MKKNHHIMPRKTATYLLTASLLFGSFLGVPTSKASAAAPVKLAKKSATLTIKKTDKKTTYGKAEINVQYLDNVLIKTIKYKSSNKKVAKVSSIGTVTAKKKGSAKITITVRYRKARKNRTKKLTYKVKVVMKDTRKKAKKTPKPKTTAKPTSVPSDSQETKKPGLYNSQTGKLEKSWDELLKNNYIKVVNGVLSTNACSSNDFEIWENKEISEILSGDIVIPNNVTGIGKNGFSFCTYLTDISIPNSVTDIGNFAFGDCTNLKSISIPKSVVNIGRNAFGGCNELENMNVHSKNTIYDSRNNCNAIIETATNKLMSGCQRTIIPNTVTTIGDFAFSSCRNLNAINIPNSVNTIGESAFQYCNNLTSINIPNGVTTIRKSTFYDCEKLTDISISSNLTSIEEDAFFECFKLKKIDLPNSVSHIGEGAFGACCDLVDFNFPNKISSIENSTFSGCRSLTGIVIPNGVTSIGNSAFRDCENMSSISIPNSVTNIGNYAFEECKKLVGMIIPESVTTIGEYAFSKIEMIIYNGTAEGTPWGAFEVISNPIKHNESDETALKKIIAEQKALGASSDIDNLYMDYYVWDNQGYLISINWYDCGLSGSISFSQLKHIETIDLSQNLITSLDVGGNSALGCLECDDNQLTSLDVSKNIFLTELYCQKNQLMTLNVSNNTILTKLRCDDTVIVTGYNKK